MLLLVSCSLLRRTGLIFHRIVTTQFLGVPLYWYNKDLYYAYMALTKQSFGIFVTTLTQWWSPTVVRISGDASVAGQLRKTPDGRVECHFPDRIVMIANHQVGNMRKVAIKANLCSYTRTGFTFGGLRIRTNLECTAIYSLSLKNL